MRRLFAIYFLAGAAMAQIQLMQQASAPDSAAAPAGTGSIQGVVLDGATHAPLAKAQVTITGAVNVPLTAVTGADGQFAIRQLGQGSYWLNASKNGYNAPQTITGPDPNTGVTLANGEEKKGVEISLLPGGEISGRVVDEEGVAVRGCTVSAVQLIYEQNQRTLSAVSGGRPTDDKGDYRVWDLAAGRYYVFAHCQVELPAPHPLLPRGDPRTPHETYLPQFYGGGLDPSTATRLTIVPGAPLQNVDFRMMRAPAFTLRGSLGANVDTLPGGVSLLLLPANPMMRSLMLTGAAVDPQTGNFQVNAVAPGGYVLRAFRGQDGGVCAAQRPVEVATAAPDPVALRLECGGELKGSLQFESEDHAPNANNQIILTPLDGAPFIPQPHAEVDKDGAFTFSNVPAGRWRLMVSVQGFVKSASLAGQPISPDGFQVAAGSAGPLRIVVGSKMTEVRVEVTGAPPDRQISALIFPEDTTRLGIGLERTGAALGTGHIDFGGMAPGRYRIIALDSSNPAMILQRPDWLKALESHTTAVDVPEGGRVSATVDILPREELLRAINE